MLIVYVAAMRCGAIQESTKLRAQRKLWRLGGGTDNGGETFIHPYCYSPIGSKSKHFPFHSARRLPFYIVLCAGTAWGGHLGVGRRADDAAAG